MFDLLYTKHPVKLKIKAKGRGNTHLFEIQKKNYSGSTDMGRRPDSILKGRKKAGFVSLGPGVVS